MAQPNGVYLPRVWAGVLGSVLTAALIAVAASTISLSTRVAVIEGNRFTASDALMMRRDIEAGIPPDQVIRWLEQIDRRLERLESEGG